MSRCAEIRELIPWYLSGALTNEEEREVAAHLSQCDACRDELVSATRLRLDVHAIVDDEPGPSSQLRDEVMRRTLGRRLAQLDVGSFFLGFSLGANLRKRNVPIRGDLNVMGRKVRLFDTGKRGGER